MILRKDAIGYLNRKLSLPSTGMEQDWEIELANLNRIEEFILFYRGSLLNEEEKKALMALIIASYDDYLNEKNSNNVRFENDIFKLLNEDKKLFKELIVYWSVPRENNPEDYFKITPFIRSVNISI